MLIYKVILRFDFDFNSSIVDSAGYILQSFADKKGYDVFESRDNRQMVLQKTDKDNSVFKNFTIGPTFFSFMYENAKGLSFNDFHNNKDLSKLIDLAKSFSEKFVINTIVRGGLRIIVMDALDTNVFEKFAKTYNSELISLINNKLGTPDDYGITIDGTHEDKIGYKIAFGPYLEKNDLPRFVKIGKELKLKDSINFIQDVDLFEQNFDFKNYYFNPNKWIKPLVKKTEEFSKENIKLLLKL